MNRTGTCACLLQSSFSVFGIQSCISQLTLDKAIWTCSPGLLKFFHYFYLCFFQDAACKRPLWTEDHFSHCSFVCWEDSTWVGVGINNQIQGAGGGGWGGGGGGGHTRKIWVVYCPTKAFKPWPCFRQKSFILLPCLRQETRFQDPAYLVLYMSLMLGKLCKHFLCLWH